MTNTVLMLGPVEFQAFEIPAGINIGGRQLVTLHQLAGGRRVIDCIGAADSDISFEGIFSGPTATQRAQALNLLRITGDTLTLSWNTFFYSVILQRFDAVFQSPTWVPYRITCTVVRDDSYYPTAPALTLSDSILADLSTAAATCTISGIDFSAAQAAISDPNAAVVDTDAYAEATASIATTQAALNRQITGAEAQLQASVVPTSNQPASLAAALNTASSAAQDLAMLSTAAAYTGQAALNLTTASS